jgi:Uma2 family endonuclease
MSVVAPTTVVCDSLWTVAAVERMPDGYRYEILDGVLYMTAMPEWGHGLVIQNLNLLITPWVRSRRLGQGMGPQTGIYWSEFNYLDPDLIFVREDRLPGKKDRARTAALAIEVCSPSNLRAPREVRETLFLRAAVEEIWYVDEPSRTLEVRRLGEHGYSTVRIFQGGDTVSSVVLPGLEFSLATAWQYLDD